MTWDGEERRRREVRKNRDDAEDHDVLTRIDENLKNFMKQFENHLMDDKLQFDLINKDTADIKKYLWMGLGIISFVVFASKFIKWGS